MPFLFLFTVPGVPQSVSVTSPSSTSLLVTWDHPLPPDRNGVITGYTVLSRAGNEMNTTELFSNDTSHLLAGLVPFTEYTITVAGNTSAGQGEFSVPFTVRTLNDSEWWNDIDDTFVRMYMCVCCGNMQENLLEVCGLCTHACTYSRHMQCAEVKVALLCSSSSDWK